MVITLIQSESSLMQEFDVEIGENYYRGSAGNVHKQQEISLYNKNSIIWGDWHFTSPINLIPFLHWFGLNKKTRKFVIRGVDGKIGEFYLSTHGFSKSRYVISIGKDTFFGYDVSDGAFNHLCIYKGDVQIGLIETYMTTVNARHTHKLFLLDDHESFARIFALFAIYYSNYRFTLRRSSLTGSRYVREKTISRYNSMYKKEWLAEHFPNEKYF